MKNQTVALLALLTLAGTTFAAPRESRNAPATVEVPFETTSADFTLHFNGTDAGGAYNATRIHFDGTMTAVAAFTYAFDTIVDVTPPGGAPISYRMSQNYDEYVQEVIALNVSLQGSFPPAGDWLFSCTDDFNDSDGGVECTLDGFVITLDDQPVVAPTATNLGALVDQTLISQEVSLGETEVKWFKFVNGDVSGAARRTLNINTQNSTLGGDSQIGIYTDGGALVDFNDDFNGNLFSQLTFGHHGDNGDLPAGTHYLAISTYDVVFSEVEWDVTTDGEGGTFQLDILQSQPTNPAATGAVTGIDNVLFTVTVEPAVVPPSTGITVHASLSVISGPANAVFHDDGLNGDVTAGDLIFSYTYTIPASVEGGLYTVTATVTDAQARSATADIIGSVFRPIDLGAIGAGAGGTEVVTTIDVPIDPAGEIVWYKFSIGTDCLNASTNYMDIDTEPSADDGTPTVGSINDTEIGIYNVDGTLRLADDDDGSNYHSQATFGDETNIRPAFGNGFPGDGFDGDLLAGTYYIGVGLFNCEFAANFIATSSSAATGTVQLNFRTNIPGGGGGAICGAADLGGVGGAPGADNHLDNNDFVVFIDFFFNHNVLADQGGVGGAPGADGIWDNNDFVVFIDNFFTAPASCR